MLTFFRKISTACALMLLLAVLASYGCGKKGPPLPPEEEKAIKAP